MKPFSPFSLNLRGQLREFSQPAVMGIINVTPDSFFGSSRMTTSEMIESQATKMIAEGVDIIDLGGYSSRPGADDVSPSEETDRLLQGIEAIRGISSDIPVSVDTFRADVARQAIEAGADIVNDISGGNLDPDMHATVAQLRVPYIAMHMRGTPQTMSQQTSYNDVTTEVIAELSHTVNKLALLGVNDVIIDPGFGFGKTLEQNYQLLARLEAFACLNRPMLVGVSRKSMIHRLLDTTPDNALNGTTAIDTIALMAGASILRVHDVRPAVENVKIYMETISHL